MFICLSHWMFHRIFDSDSKINELQWIYGLKWLYIFITFCYLFFLWYICLAIDIELIPFYIVRAVSRNKTKKERKSKITKQKKPIIKFNYTLQNEEVDDSLKELKNYQNNTTRNKDIEEIKKAIETLEKIKVALIHIK